MQKAFQRLSTAIWRVLLGAALSGWARSYASRHYTQRMKLVIRSLKTTLLVDTQAQTVLDVHVTTTRKHDTQIGPQLTERNLEQFQTLAADKGYDDQVYRDRLRAWGKRPLIKHREFAPYDKAANARLDQGLYHRRSLVETVISVLKRKYGSAVSSRVWWRREMVVCCYNVERAVKLGVALLDWLRACTLYFLHRRISTEPIHTFELRKPDSVPNERFLGLMQRARRIAIEIDGVYDLALYQMEQSDLWQCSLDVEDEETWQRVQTEPQLQRLWGELQALGVQIVGQNHLERRI